MTTETELDTKILGRNYAYQQQFRALTTPYKPEEKEMLQAVLRDMQRGNIPHCLVLTDEGYEVWRKGMKTTRKDRVYDMLLSLVRVFQCKEIP